jgi:hypothetical protein
MALVHRGVSRSPIPLSLVIDFLFLSFCSSQADGADSCVCEGEGQHIEPCIEKSDGDPAVFAVVFAIVQGQPRRFDVQFSGASEWDAVLPSIASVFGWIERYIHEQIVCTK